MEFTARQLMGTLAVMLVLFVWIPEAKAVTAQIATGSGHSLALKADGSLWAWGYNWGGQLGDSTTTEHHSPVQIGSDYTAIAVGDYHSLGLKADGNLWAWGDNGRGQLGDGTTTERHSPVQVGTGYIAVAAGHSHSLAIKSDGSLWAWGYNWNGQLGDGTTTARYSPVQIGSGYTTVAAGSAHSFALKADGSLWAWGYNGFGQLGDGTSSDRYLPVQIGNGYISISSGGSSSSPHHSVALKVDGSLWAWGYNGNGQLGDGTTTERHSPVQVGTGYTVVSAAGAHSLALKADSSLWAWGSNEYGKLGDGTTTERYSPVQVGTGYTAVSAGWEYTLALKSDGSLWAWGANGTGQLGDGTTTERHIPTAIGFNLLDSSQPVPVPIVAQVAASVTLGSSSNAGITALITPASTESGSANIYIAAVWQGALYLRGSSTRDWRPYTGGPFPVVGQIALNGPSTVTVTDYDLSAIPGLQLYVGYGANDADVLSLPGHLARIHEVPSPTPISGSCGTSHGLSLSTAPTTGLCSAGSASSISGAGPWSWSCSGSNGGASASCSASLTPPSTTGRQVLHTITGRLIYSGSSSTISVARTHDITLTLYSDDTWTSVDDVSTATSNADVSTSTNTDSGSYVTGVSSGLDMYTDARAFVGQALDPSLGRFSVISFPINGATAVEGLWQASSETYVLMSDGTCRQWLGTWNDIATVGYSRATCTFTRR